MPTTKATPGQLLRRARLASGLTQSDLASALGVTQATVSRHESDRPGGPWLSAVKLWAAARLLDVPPAALGLSAGERCPHCGSRLVDAPGAV